MSDERKGMKELIKCLDFMHNECIENNWDNLSEGNYKQIRQLIEQQSEQNEIHLNFIDIILDLYEQLEEQKPKVEEEKK